MSADTLTFHHEIEGLAVPALISAEFEAPDYSCGVVGGWFLVEAFISGPQERSWRFNRAEFAFLFGRTALQVAEESAYDVAQDRRYEDQDRREEEVGA